ncbi:hypothetical protein [Pedobacter paludis]|nr:hypothetical protein [Pedobacter paludis]
MRFISLATTIIMVADRKILAKALDVHKLLRWLKPMGKILQFIGYSGC